MNYGVARHSDRQVERNDDYIIQANPEEIFDTQDSYFQRGSPGYSYQTSQHGKVSREGDGGSSSMVGYSTTVQNAEL